MTDFFELSSQDKILLALATLKNDREPEEIAAWINQITEYYAGGQGEEFLEKNKRAAGTIKNYMSQMSKKQVGKQSGKQKEFVLEQDKDGKKFTYRSGKYTVNSRLAALILILLWKTYNANNYSLTKEQAIKIAENEKDLILEITKGKDSEDIKWLMSEISKEKPANNDVLDSKLDYILKANYFCKESRSISLVVPTDRLMKDEKKYIEALIYLLPELETIQNPPKSQKSKGN